MTSGTEDKAKGKFHEIKGKVKEEVGKVANSPELEAEGKDEKNMGKVQKKIGEIKKVFGEWWKPFSAGSAGSRRVYQRLLAKIRGFKNWTADLPHEDCEFLCRHAIAVSEKPMARTPQIAKRAYALYEQRNLRDGQADQDWLQAEQEIRKDESPK